MLFCKTLGRIGIPIQCSAKFLYVEKLTRKLQKLEKEIVFTDSYKYVEVHENCSNGGKVILVSWNILELTTYLLT